MNCCVFSTLELTFYVYRGNQSSFTESAILQHHVSTVAQNGQTKHLMPLNPICWTFELLNISFEISKWDQTFDWIYHANFCSFILVFQPVLLSELTLYFWPELNSTAKKWKTSFSHIITTVCLLIAPYLSWALCCRLVMKCLGFYWGDSWRRLRQAVP